MRSLTEIKGDEALDIIADLVDPITEIFADTVVKNAYSVSKLEAVKVAIKTHKKAVKKIVAIMNEEDPETYDPNILEIPARLMQILTDKNIQDLFTSQGQNSEEDTSGSATENTKERK